MSTPSCEVRINDQMNGRQLQFAALLTPGNLDDAEVINLYVEQRGTLSALDAAIVAAPDAHVDTYAKLADRLREVLRNESPELIEQSVLGVSTCVSMRIELSTGGPGDWLEAELDEREVLAVSYHFNDWFDHAERRVMPGTALWQLAEYFAETVTLP